MKKIILTIILSIILMASNLWALTPGTCVQTPYQFASGGMILVKFVCTASPDDGAMPNQAIDSATMNLLIGTHYLYTVSAYPTAGETAPDAADVFILDANLEDLLGSVDGGTTANKGLNLINATLKKTTLPYSHYLSLHYFPPVLNTLTLKILNQATHSANYTIELIFAR